MLPVEERFRLFKEKSINKFGDKFDYSQVDYTKNDVKVKISCKEHGEFWTTPMNHLVSMHGGCPECYTRWKRENKLDTQEIFIEKMRKKFGNDVSFEKTVYVQSNQPVTITYKGEDFTATPNRLLTKFKFKKYSRGKVVDTETLIKEASKIHNNKYDYSKSQFKGSKTKVCIICPEHGEFWQTPEQHLKGRGCQACGHIKTCDHTRGNTEDFVKRAKEIWGDLYDYSKVEYQNNHDKVIVICKEHGEFLIAPSNHLAHKGCPICKTSKGELKIKEYLDSRNIKYNWQYSIHLNCLAKLTNLIIADFFIEIADKKCIIEYNGIQHYQYISCFHEDEDAFKRQLRRDAELRKHCLENNIYLLEIKYDNKNIEETLDNFLESLKE